MWHEQGLPEEISHKDNGAEKVDVYFGMDAYSGGPSPHVGLFPAWEWKTIEDRGDHELVQQNNGVIVLRKKVMGSIPHHHAHLLVDRDSWEKIYKPRLMSDTPGRFPSDWSDRTRQWQDPARPTPCVASCGSLYGWLRDWMGVENLSMVVYDDPAWFEDMITTVADVVVAALEKSFEHGAKYDAGAFWEDMCYNAGPLLSPAHFKQYMVPQYRHYQPAPPTWMRHCLGRLRRQNRCADPVMARRRRELHVSHRGRHLGCRSGAVSPRDGRDLLMMGGFDKHILARSTAQIEKEVLRLTPLVEEGGFIGFADHRVPPDVPFENYLFYLKTVRRVWGKNTALKPAAWENAALPVG